MKPVPSMLFDVLSKLFRKSEKPAAQDQAKQANLQNAARLMASGDTHGAILALREYLQSDPSNVQALNDLGACLADIGDMGEASATFELAYALDDTYIPVVVNHAKLLNDRRHSAQAMPFLRQAKIYEPNFSHVNAVYAGVALALGDIPRARRYQLKAWLANFDNLRHANSYLFYSSYDDLDEKTLAAEHRFWAETAISLADTAPPDMAPSDQKVPGARRIRIGYWSPDFRNHSVRYFFRPLLENHDTERFEVFLFHDFPKMDEQSQLIRDRAEHFHDVCQMSDEAVCAFIQSKQLDVLVELAGHSSHNRISLLQRRLARLQVSALGYPPTTGLASVDAKLVDRHIVSPAGNGCYTEWAAPLPGSFWCFDPYEDAPVAEDPPCVKNGFLTLGCVGNLGKINDRILGSWVQILAALPTSRLLIRSISLEDDAAEVFIRDKFLAAGMDLSRVDFHKPQGGANFFHSYNEIDLILDTYPFNGGTTTCFATYMGVPVVSLHGVSLLSRMGLSILSNLDAAELVASDLDGYTAKAIAVGRDWDFIQNFKRQARQRFKNSPLGNGGMYARDFEATVFDLLNQKTGNGLPAVAPVAYLPVNELVRRAYAVYQSGHAEAAQRIVAHCLRAYPQSAGSHLLRAQHWQSAGQWETAIEYLESILAQVDLQARAEVLLTLTRLRLLIGQPIPAAETLRQLEAMDIADSFDQAQRALYGACLASAPTQTPIIPAAVPTYRFCLVIPCDDEQRFHAMEGQIRRVAVLPSGWTMRVLRCDESHRMQAYQAAAQDAAFDAVVVAQKNIEIHRADFFTQVQAALNDSDIVGFAGATRWNRLDWRVDEPLLKCGGFITLSSEKADVAEIQIIGLGKDTLCGGMAVLDGALFAFRRESLQAIAMDEELLGGETLLEEDWLHAAQVAGRSLCVHRNLGVFVDSRIELDASQTQMARLHCTDKRGFDPFAPISDSHLALSAPVPSIDRAVQVMRIYFGSET